MHKQKMGCKYGCHIKHVRHHSNLTSQEGCVWTLRNGCGPGLWFLRAAKGEVRGSACMCLWWGGKKWRSWKELQRYLEWLFMYYCMTFTIPTATKFDATLNRLGWRTWFWNVANFLNRGPTELVLWGLTILKMHSKFKWVFSSHKDIWTRSGSDSPRVGESAQNVSSPFQGHKPALSMETTPGGESTKWRYWSHQEIKLCHSSPRIF